MEFLHDKSSYAKIFHEVKGDPTPFISTSSVLGSLTVTCFNDSINGLSRKDSFWKSVHISIYLNLAFVQHFIESLKMSPVLVAYPHSLRDAYVKYIGRNPGCNVI